MLMDIDVVLIFMTKYFLVNNYVHFPPSPSMVNSHVILEALKATVIKHKQIYTSVLADLPLYYRETL